MIFSTLPFISRFNQSNENQAFWSAVTWPALLVSRCSCVYVYDNFKISNAGAERDHDRVDVRPREFRSETSAAENLAAYHCGPKFSGNCRRKGAYACHLCPYTSYSRGDVIKHVRVHTGERPFKCTICPYASTQRQNVTVHMRKHSKEKLFSCYICGSTYKLQQDLQRHLERCTNNMQ